jgi:hypothetical protein
MKMTKPIDDPRYSPEETELAKRLMCAHITIIQNKSFDECWQKYIEPAERIEEYYLGAARSLLKSYEEDHQKGSPEAVQRTNTSPGL